MFLDSFDGGICVWIVNLDLPTAFDRVKWDTLRRAFLDHGLWDHLAWMLQVIYWQNSGQVRGEHRQSNVCVVACCDVTCPIGVMLPRLETIVNKFVT